MLDRTLLEQVVWGMPEGLVDEIVVAGGYRVEQIEYFATREQGIEVTIVRKPSRGLVAPLATAATSFQDGSRVSMAMSSRRFGWRTHSMFTPKTATGTPALWEVEDPTRFGIVGVDAHQRVTAFKEKPKPEEVFSNLINAGSYLLEEEVFDVMPSAVIRSSVTSSRCWHSANNSTASCLKATHRCRNAHFVERWRRSACSRPIYLGSCRRRFMVRNGTSTTECGIMARCLVTVSWQRARP